MGDEASMFITAYTGNRSVVSLESTTDGVNWVTVGGSFVAARASLVDIDSGIVTSSVTVGKPVTLIGVPSSAYMFFHPLSQAVGAPVDTSGKGAHGVVSPAYNQAGLWANPGVATIEAGVGKCYYVPTSKVQFDLETESILIAFTVKKAVPLSSTEILASTWTGVSGTGFLLGAATTGKLRYQIRTNSGTFAGFADGATTAFEAVAVERNVAMAIDSVTKSTFLYVDGIINGGNTNCYTGSTATVRPLVVGATNASETGISSVATQAGQYSNMHMLKWPGGLPNNINAIASRLSANPGTLLTVDDAGGI